MSGFWKHLVQGRTLTKVLYCKCLKNVFLGVIAVMLTRDMLVSIRRVAMRKRVWFKVLSRAERAVISLTIRCVDRVRSAKLAMIVTAIVDKLEEAVRSRVERLMGRIGSSLARAIAEIAVSWGNLEAEKWALDQGFIRYVTVMKMNLPFSRF